MQKSKIVESKRKIQKKKGDLKMKKTRFYLPTLFCAALLCLGATSYAKAEEGTTPKGWQKGEKKGWEGNVPPGLEKKGDFIPPGLNKQAKHKWLKKHPAVAAKLANNPKWLKKHPEVAKKLFGNEKWLAAHPKVARAMYRNKQWVKNHPKIAKKIYNNKKFLAKHPGIAKRVKKRADINKDGRVDAKERGIARQKYKKAREFRERDLNRDRKISPRERKIDRRTYDKRGRKANRKRINKGVRDHGKGLGRGKGRGVSQRKARTHNKSGERRSGRRK